MFLRDDLNACAPRLRRYARALAAGHPGPSETADELVHAALRRALEQSSASRREDVHILLYSVLTELHRDSLRTAKIGASAAVEKGSFYGGGLRPAESAPRFFSSRDSVSDALAALRLEEREALLLVALEGFSYAQAARILKISRPILLARLARARTAIGDSLAISQPPTKTKPRPAHLRLVKS